MDPSSPSGSLILFLVLALASGLLSGLRNVLSHFEHHYPNLQANRGERPSDAHLIERAHQAWHKPGFFESLSLGRYLFDLLAGYQGLFFFHSLGMSWWIALAVTIILGYLPAHWLIPALSQAFAHKLGGFALGAYRIYRLLLMGAIGDTLGKLNGLLLAKLGFDPKLSFLGKDQIQQLGTYLPEDEHADRSGLKEDEKEMIRSIFDLRETQAKEVMTPRVDVVALSIEAGWQEVIDCITHDKFSRIPVYQGGIDHVQGILHVMDLMGLDRHGPPESFRLSEFLREAYFVPRTKKIGDLMREFRLKHVHMAIVVDEYGGLDGLVTIEDLVEQIVGEIDDEHDVAAGGMLIQRADGVLEALGRCPIDDLEERLGRSLLDPEEDSDVDTVGGLIVSHLGRVPLRGELIEHPGGLTFEVLEADPRRVKRVRIRQPVPHSSADAA